MFFPLVLEVISRACFPLTPAFIHCIFYAVIGQSLVLILSAVSCISITLAVLQHSLYLFWSLPPPPSTYYAFLHFLDLGRRDTSCDYLRCYKWGKLGNWARDCRSTFWPASHQSPIHSTYQVSYDHRSYERNLSNCPWPRDTGATL